MDICQERDREQKKTVEIEFSIELWFTTSKMEVDNYYEKHFMRIVERMKALNLRKLGNIRKTQNSLDIE